MIHVSQANHLDLTILVPIFDRHVFMPRCLRNLEALSGLAYFVFVDSGGWSTIPEKSIVTCRLDLRVSLLWR